jgi:two-component system KDP operon response regulator KdpE
MKVLVIDDEPQIRRALKVFLEHNNHEVVLAAGGEDGLSQAAINPPELVILDLSMAGMDGFDVCKELRTWCKVPIIVLSVRDREEDKVKALDLGADDFVTKPFGMPELLARMRAVVRRASGNEPDPEANFQSGGLEIDFAGRLVSVDGVEIHLTPKEFDLLRYMSANPNRVLTHVQLLTKIWGPEYANDSHTLRVHVANLRNKIEANPERPRFIQTEPRVGYRFRKELAVQN